jgi:hypothetical protein
VTRHGPRTLPKAGGGERRQDEPHAAEPAGVRGDVAARHVPHGDVRRARGDLQPPVLARRARTTLGTVTQCTRINGWLGHLSLLPQRRRRRAGVAQAPVWAAATPQLWRVLTKPLRSNGWKCRVISVGCEYTLSNIYQRQLRRVLTGPGVS